ncbi:circadian clock protein KaiC [Methanocella sp. MCL-LM]|uniref:circadian clock protein KaiC n=1 Tax=Methanocella sp. MCL-LM TaxID=3412035 RepID=UPI003C70CD07
MAGGKTGRRKSSKERQDNSGNLSGGLKTIEKALTGIKGFDEITFGGLPRGRPTLVAGSAGSGKTMFAMEFIVHGAMDFGEPGVFVTFEENVDDLKKNFASLGYDLDKLCAEKKMSIDHVFLDRSLIHETGEYDLDALFIRLGYAIDSIGAKRVALDTIEVLFAGLSNHALLRSELVRLFRWLKDRGITAIVTGEKGERQLTRYGLEEYIADCVIFLDSRVTEQIVTRRLRIIKYRGSTHGMDEYPFLIARDGIIIFPITSIRTDYKLSREVVSSGIPQLDAMLGHKGFYRGSAILYTGTSGTGKTNFAGTYVDAACRRGERCLFIAMEETEDQIIRDLGSIGIDLGQWVKTGLLKFYISRPWLYGIEMHLVLIQDILDRFKPMNVIMDPLSDFTAIGGGKEVKSLLTRLQDMMKSRQITCVYTDLITGDINPRTSEVYISSMIDTWILLRNIEYNGERSRGLAIVKSRGMSHSNQVREFRFTNKGIDLINPYIGPSGVFMGSAKIGQEARDLAQVTNMRREIENMKAILEEKRREYNARQESMNAQLTVEESGLKKKIEQLEQDLEIMLKDREVMSRERKWDVTKGGRSDDR